MADSKRLVEHAACEYAHQLGPLVKGLPLTLPWSILTKCGKTVWATVASISTTNQAACVVNNPHCCLPNSTDNRTRMCIELTNASAPL